MHLQYHFAVSIIIYLSHISPYFNYGADDFIIYHQSHYYFTTTMLIPYIWYHFADDITTYLLHNLSIYSDNYQTISLTTSLFFTHTIFFIAQCNFFLLLLLTISLTTLLFISRWSNSSFEMPKPGPTCRYQNIRDGPPFAYLKNLIDFAILFVRKRTKGRKMGILNWKTDKNVLLNRNTRERHKITAIFITYFWIKFDVRIFIHQQSVTANSRAIWFDLGVSMGGGEEGKGANINN